MGRNGGGGVCEKWGEMGGGCVKSGEKWEGGGGQKWGEMGRGG